MRSHAAPTHIAYPHRRFIVATGRQAAVVGIGVLVALGNVKRTEPINPPRPAPVTMPEITVHTAEDGTVTREQTGTVVVQPPTPPSSLPEPLRPAAPYVRLGLIVLPLPAAALLAAADLPRRIGRELRWRRLTKRAVWQPTPTPEAAR